MAINATIRETIKAPLNPGAGATYTTRQAGRWESFATWFVDISGNQLSTSKPTVDDEVVIDKSLEIYNAQSAMTIEVIGTINFFADVVLSSEFDYDSGGGLIYSASKTVSDEMMDGAAGSARPFDVTILDDVTLDMDGKDAEIRGTLTLGTGASIINGSITEV